ncbi:DMT family transporter [Buchnera aphidicola (Hormaphis cornu)]|nr:DMT family transporter [Buchnera aphidicola (Hormaphis cornu)]
MHRLIILTLFIIVSFTWGTTWMAMKITVHTIPPLFATGMRFLLASPILIAISSVTKSPLLFPIKHRLFQIFIIFFYFTIPFTLMLYAGTCVTAGLASILFSTMPVIVLIFSLLFLKEKIMSFQILGLVIFFIALLYLLYIKCSFNNFNQIKGIFAIILAVLSHAYIYIQCKKKMC